MIILIDIIQKYSRQVIKICLYENSFSAFLAIIKTILLTKEIKQIFQLNVSKT